MDDRLRIIYQRRSIRKYTGEPVPDKLVEELLRAAMAAPSSKNGQPWEFVVVTDPAIKACIPELHPHASFAPEAAVVIIVCGRPNGPLFQQDLSAATQNILLAASELGLGTCWCGMTTERVPGIKELFSIPEDIELCSLITVGYPAASKEPRTQYDPAKVHRGVYGG